MENGRRILQSTEIPWGEGVGRFYSGLDVTEESIVKELEELKQRLTIVQEMSSTVISELDLGKVLEKIVREGCKLTSCEMGWLALLDEKKERLRVTATYGETVHMAPYEMRVDNSLLGTLYFITNHKQLKMLLQILVLRK
jgi:transcriptional regulator with GAF, ATPase, and Fis domain